MSRICQITGKKASVGNNRSHSLRATKRRFELNLHKKRIFDPVTGRWEKKLVSSAALRSLNKNPKKFSKKAPVIAA